MYQYFEEIASQKITKTIIVLTDKYMICEYLWLQYLDTMNGPFPFGVCIYLLAKAKVVLGGLARISNWKLPERQSLDLQDHQSVKQIHCDRSKNKLLSII